MSDLSDFAKECVALLEKNNKRLDLSFISRYIDPIRGKTGLLFIFTDKRAELYDNGFMQVKRFIAGNGYLFSDYVKPENLIENLEKLCPQK